MPISPLTGLYIDETYPRLVQTNDTGTEFADGLGRAISFGTTSPGDGDQAIQFNSASVFSGSAKLKYDYVNNNIVLTGSLLVSQSHISTVDYVDFSTRYDTVTPDITPSRVEGRLFYDTGSQTLCMYNAETDVTLNIGQESWLRARNQTGVLIPNGSVVKISGAVGNRPSIILAQSTDQVQEFGIDNDIIGMATHDIETGTDGFVTTFGLVNGVNTNAFNVGDLLWVSQSAGQYTNIPPSAPFDKTFVGVVTRKGNTNVGTIFVTPTQPLHFHDISSVSQSGNYTQGDIWMFIQSGSSGVWTNTKTLSGSYTLSGSLTTNDGVKVQTLTASFVSASSGITGSLYGTASWAHNAETASYILASNINGTVANATQATSASYADTASYTQNFIELTFPRINLTSDIIDPPGLPYTILTPGIYQITKAGDADPAFNSYSIIFPDPTTLNGTTITILNTDTTYNVIVDNPSSLIKNMNGNDVTSINNSSAAIFKSIDNKWWKLY